MTERRRKGDQEGKEGHGERKKGGERAGETERERETLS